jgi:HEXXH motif-containing protein
LPTVVARKEYSQQSNRKVAAALGLAGELLQQYAPGFLAWVTDADWAVAAILDPGDNRCTSFSSRGMLGVPFISFPLGPLLTAELLVHETSHNYYHCAQLAAEPCNDKDTALYPSPYVQMDRPIDRILIAFHAFANIVLLYRTMLAAGLEEQSDAAEAAITGHLPILTRFSEVLTQSPGLTAVGRAIFEPLRDRLLA